MNAGAKSIPILDVIRRYSPVELQQKGRDWWGCCPFRGEKTPSFSVDAEKGLFFCHSCHAGGSGVDFVMSLHGISFKEAATMIERDFGTGREVGPVAVSPTQIRYKKEATLARKIDEVFAFVVAAREAIQAELKRRGRQVPVEMIRDLGRLATIEDELIGEPKQIATGLRLFKKWFPKVVKT